MSVWHTHTLTLSLDPIEASQYYNADFMQQQLIQARELVEDKDEAELWAKASFVASNPAQPPLFLQYRRGCSIAFACVPGLVFEYVPDYVLSSEEYKQFDTLIQQMIAKVATLATTKLSLPFSSRLRLETTWLYGFKSGYRRRLAYALAYEASIKVNSLAPFDEYLDSLILGNVERLHTSLQNVVDNNLFSILLNLLALLDRAIAYEYYNNQPCATLPGKVSQGIQKRTMLQDWLLQAADMKAVNLSSDGKIAINGLLDELEHHRHIGGPVMFGRPWGTIPNVLIYEE